MDEETSKHAPAGQDDETPSSVENSYPPIAAKGTFSSTVEVKIFVSTSSNDKEENNLSPVEETKRHDTMPQSCETPALAMSATATTAAATTTATADASASAAATAGSDDYTVAQALQTVETLTNVFQFSSEHAHLAIEAVGPDSNAAYNWILNNNLAEDKGGPIVPKRCCPHIEHHMKVTVEDLQSLELTCSHYVDNGSETKEGNGKVEIDEATGICPVGENWLCLECNITRCSRYVNGHCKLHWETTKQKALEESSSSSTSPNNNSPQQESKELEENEKAGHCIAVSLEDLSVWCYECHAYLDNPDLSPILKRLEELKFGSDEQEEYVDDAVSAKGGKEQNPNLPKSMKELAEFILSDDCESIVVLAGAGMSRASGIPDFRSAGGMYETLQPDLLTASESDRMGMTIDPTMVYEKDFFLENSLPCLELQRPFIFGTKEKRWKATIAHRFVELLHAKIGKLTRIYTQNIDGLEGQCTNLLKSTVIPVHGSFDRASCESCGAEMNYDEFCAKVETNIKDITGEDKTAPADSTPIACETCGRFTVKPNIVLFRSPLPDVFFESIVNDLPSTSLLMVIGTSLCVGPANSLVYMVPPTAIRAVFDNSQVGMSLGIKYGEDSVRDYFAQGACEEKIAELMDHLGWIDDLSDVIGDLPDGSQKIVEQRQKNSVGDIRHPKRQKNV